MMTLKLDRHIAILGGSSGIGLATSRLAADRGARITLGSRDQVRLTAAAAHTGAMAVPVDAEDMSSLAGFFRAAGPIDDLVITLTRRGRRPSREGDRLGLADLAGSFAGKAVAVLRAVGESLDALSEDGSITLVGGVTAQAGFAGTAEAAAVNGAVEAAVAPLARELAPRRVNAVSPGVIATEWWDSLGEHRDTALETFARRTPLGRNGRPEDVALAILALIDNPFITGVVLPVDGGIRLT
ncbi:SDR family oxidoreductase [Kutzneria sp. CA-103260]|uniref:SDR family oxidoreductase n=1 Tax=Kutzneria sp. CA-103260 TaxID=2802641 RepID=UPI001BAD5354|nr:SDR family oxidoreductase [Kutzneria sp. CA-103260]QUQ64741.1 short-chain dehydrogenase/reductase SDR [Kutzneria sp. CA-103260]